MVKMCEFLQLKDIVDWSGLGWYPTYTALQSLIHVLVNRASKLHQKFFRLPDWTLYGHLLWGTLLPCVLKQWRYRAISIWKESVRDAYGKKKQCHFLVVPSSPIPHSAQLFRIDINILQHDEIFLPGLLGIIFPLLKLRIQTWGSSHHVLSRTFNPASSNDWFSHTLVCNNWMTITSVSFDFTSAKRRGRPSWFSLSFSSPLLFSKSFLTKLWTLGQYFLFISLSEANLKRRTENDRS